MARVASASAESGAESRSESTKASASAEKSVSSIASVSVRPKMRFRPDAREQQLLVVLVSPASTSSRVLGDRRGHALQHLQDADVVGDGEHVHRHDHAQVEAAVGNRLDRAHGLLRAHLAQHVRARAGRGSSATGSAPD